MSRYRGPSTSTESFGVAMFATPVVWRHLNGAALSVVIRRWLTDLPSFRRSTVIVLARGLLNEDEALQFDEAFNKGRAAGTAFLALPLHCAMGTRAS